MNKVTAVVDEDGTVFVPVRPLCDLLGVQWSGQHRKIVNDPVLSTVANSVYISGRSSDSGSNKPNTSEMICLPLNYLNGWLFSINANRVKDETREAVIRYQTDYYNVLFEAFSTGVAVRPDSDIMQSTEETAVTYRTLVQLAKIACEHYYMGKRLYEHDDQFEDHTKRLGLIEAQLSNPAAYVMQEQAQLISSGVKAIATVLGKQSGRNEFGAVYGELYQRHGMTSYKQLAAEQYDDVNVNATPKHLLSHAVAQYLHHECTPTFLWNLLL